MRCKNLIYTAVASFLVSVVALAAVLNLTSPDTSGLAGILLVFFLIYMASLGVIMFLATLGYYSYRLIRPLPASALAGVKQVLYYRRLIAICTILSFVPIVLMSFNSIGKLGLLDVVLITVTEALAILYTMKRLK